MTPSIFNASVDPGNYHWQWHWGSWWALWPHYRAEDDFIDYGVPEYAHMYPHYQVNWFCFSCFQACWYSDYQKVKG